MAGYTYGALPGQINRGGSDAFLLKLLHTATTAEPDSFSPK